MSTDEQGLLASIIDNPEDDAPRLVYADWLEEYGDERQRARAELIRLQIRRYHDRPNPDASMSWVRGGETRISDIYDQYRDGWIAELGFPPNRMTSFRLSRGMIGWIDCTPKYFIDHGADCLSRAPIVCALFKGIKDGNAAKLARCEAVARLRDIRLYPISTPASAVVRFFRELPPGLRAFTFHNAALDWVPRHDQMIADVVQCPSMSEVRAIRLHSAGGGDAAGRAIAESPYLDKLEMLDLRMNSLGDGVLRRVKERFGEKVWRQDKECNRFTFAQIGWA